MIERRKHPRLPHAITMEQAKLSATWQRLQREKLEKEKLTQEKGRKK